VLDFIRADTCHAVALLQGIASREGAAAWWLAYSVRARFYARIALPRDSFAAGGASMPGELTIELRKVRGKVLCV
jgi:hypothetical protein